MPEKGCMQHAGILDDEEKLTPAAKAKIIKRIQESGEKGFSNVSKFPCGFGKDIPPTPGLVPQDLHNEEKYPDFHKDILGTYEKIAQNFNISPSPALPFPFCDPAALGLKLGIEVPAFPIVDIPTLTPIDLLMMLKMKEFEIPNLMHAFTIPDPSLPNLGLDLPVPKIPTLDIKINNPFDLRFQQKFEFDGWQFALPTKIFEFAIGLLDPGNFDFLIKIATGDICPLVDKIAQGEVFGPTPPGASMKKIVAGDMTTFSGECGSIAAVATAVGTSEGGPTGQMGKKFGYKEAVEVDTTEQKNADRYARNAIIEGFKKIFGRNPSLAEAQFIQCVARAENGYGQKWQKFSGMGKDEKGKPKPLYVQNPEGAKSNNWGNIHAGAKFEFVKTAGTFLHTDADANGKPYSVHFAKFATPADGATALIENVYLRRPYVLASMDPNIIEREKPILWNPTFLMSSKAVWGSNYKKAGQPKVVPASDALMPEIKLDPKAIGYSGFYEVDPLKYFEGMKVNLTGKGSWIGILENIGEENAFDFQPPPSDENSLLDISIGDIKADRR